jgi:hypothetical protein
MVATPSLEEELRGRGFNNLVRWSRGVDLDRYYPRLREPCPIPVRSSFMSGGWR